MSMITLPSRLDEILNKDKDLANVVINILRPFASILEGNIYFFPDYTDHSIRHNEEVLTSIEQIVSEDTLNELSPADVGVLVTAVALHDIGMHTNHEMFKNMIDGKYDNIPGNWFKEKSWKELWHDYLKESHYWDATKRENITGDVDYIIDEESLSNKINNKLKLDGRDIRFIGEFIRKHHPRLAYEIALKGYICNTTYGFKDEDLPEYFMQLSGLVARSHGINVRDAIEILKQNLSDDEWKTPSDIKVVYLMTLIRIADYLQIHPSRSNKVEMSLRTIDSPNSKLEHEMHEAIKHIHLGNDDPERIIVQAKPENAPIYVKIKDTVQDIQKEFDLSWAILGEVYGSKYKLRFRRIVTTITDKKKIKTFKFVPKQFGFKFNNSLPKLLITPLYGNNPSYGVRELVQNAVDACRTRMALDKDYSNKTDFTHVTVTINPSTALFSIKDTGIGMNIEEIEKYFLTIGSSYNSSTNWKKTQDISGKDINNIYRTGRFGIGILAAFLLGPSITVRTKRLDCDHGYEFTLSLDQDFIQINKIDLPDCGTTIEIKCERKALEILIEDAKGTFDKDDSHLDVLWFDWYVDSKPKVEYFIGILPIKTKTNLFTDYKMFSPESTDYRDIYWKQSGFSKPRLYCNGFLITRESNKTNFSNQNHEKYLPYNYRIPSLKVTDIYNQLSLNLQRNNIDANATFDFELDLLIAMCKDFLCQLLAYDINTLTNVSGLFLHRSGFTFNQNASFPINRHGYARYSQKCLHRKILIHILSRTNHYQTWKPFIETHPEAFFTFNQLHRKIDKVDFYRIIELIHRLCQYEFSFDIDEIIEHSLEADSIRYYVNRAVFTTRDRYTIISRNSNLKLVRDLFAFISSLPYEEKPAYFLIHTNLEGKDEPSDLDDFIKEYAGGDMIIPYEEEERKRKFAKIYKECGEDIERYRKKYQQLL